jgi:gliding motility-associated-like protein
MLNYKYVNFGGLSIFLAFISQLAMAQMLPKQSIGRPRLKIVENAKISALHPDAVPVITPKKNLIFLLNSTGQLTINPADIATVTGATEVTTDIKNFDCSKLGNQVITVTAKGDPVPPSSVKFFNPWGMGSDAAGNLYIADVANARIRKIATNGDVTTFAGTGAQGPADGPNALATFMGPDMLAVAPSGTVYAADEGDGAIRKISGGQVTTIINHYFVSGLAVDNNNNLYAVKNSSIVKIADDGTITTLVTGLGAPYGINFDKSGNLYVSDIGTYEILKITPAGTVSTVVSNFPFLSYIHFINGNPVDNYAALAVDSHGNIFVAQGYVIWKVKPDGTYSLFAGTTDGFKDGQGTDAQFSGTWGITTDAQDNLYVTDWRYTYGNDDGNNAIRKITPGGFVTTLAGGVRGFSNGTVGSNVQAVKPITVKIVTQPVLGHMNDDELTAGNNCLAALPDYTLHANATDPCPGVHLQITQSLASGTLLNPGDQVTITLTAADGYGGQNSTDFLVRVKAGALPALTIQADYTHICPGTPVTFTAIPTNPGTGPQYQWMLNGLPVGANSVTYSNNGLKSTDIIACKLTNNDACVSLHTATSNSISIVVNSMEPPSVTIASSAIGAACKGTLIIFTATALNPQANPVYQWKVNNVDAGENSPVFSSADLNDGDVVQCYLSNTGETCVANPTVMSNLITVAVSPLPTINASNSITIKRGEKVQLLPLITGAIKSYAWEPVTGLSDATIATPLAAPLQTTTYHLLIISTDGCTATQDVTVNVTQDIFIPNSFTPNSDGKNDRWELSFLQSYPTCTVKVYTRYGQPVYHAGAYNSSWDGTYNQTPVPSGTYYYIIDLKNNTPPLSGYVTIIR